MALTSRGQLLQDVLAGHEVGGVAQVAMEKLCDDLFRSRPCRFIRAHHDVKRGGWRVALIGPPDPAFVREDPRV